jgi:serine acetyltransferase
MGERPGVTRKSAYEAAEDRMRVPPIRRRGLENENPPELGFWQLLREDFETHDYNPLEQGFWAVANHRFGNWRLGLKNPLLRAPCSLAYDTLQKGIELVGGITLPCTTKLGRRVRLWHHGGMIIGARAIGSDVQIRQNTTIGVAHAWREEDLPIIEDGVDIGCGASILGPVVVGRGAKLGANAVVLEDVPEGATATGNPARIGVAPAPAAPNGERSSTVAAGPARGGAEQRAGSRGA